MMVDGRGASCALPSAILASCNWTMRLNSLTSCSAALAARPCGMRMWVAWWAWWSLLTNRCLLAFREKLGSQGSCDLHRPVELGVLLSWLVDTLREKWLLPVRK